MMKRLLWLDSLELLVLGYICRVEGPSEGAEKEHRRAPDALIGHPPPLGSQILLHPPAFEPSDNLIPPRDRFIKGEFSEIHPETTEEEGERGGAVQGGRGERILCGVRGGQ